MGAQPELVSPRPDEKLEKKISRLIATCTEEWNLIEDGDKVLVGISGGKDSYTLLHMLMRMQRVAPIRFELLAFHLDQGHPAFPTEKLEQYLDSVGVPWMVHHQDTYSIVLDKLEPGQTTCSLCSRLRRGVLYNQAMKHGCTKIALGHHRGDTIETLLLNILYSGQLKAMPAKLRSDDRRNTVIRPMLYVPEALIVEFSRQMRFPIIPCTLCSRQPDLKRADTKALLDELEEDNANVRGNLLAALGNVVPSHLLDKAIFDPAEDYGTVDPADFDEAVDI